MAKTVVFESERISKWEANKHFVILAIAFVVVIIGAVVAALFIRGSRGETFTGGEDTPYPYNWTVNKDGTVRLEVSRSAAPGYLWAVSYESTGIQFLSAESDGASAESSNFSTLTIKPDKKQADDTSAFILTPTASGRAVLLLDLQREDDEVDLIYEMTILTEVLEENGSLQANLISVSGAEQQGVLRGGQDTPYPYMAGQSDSGELIIVVTKPKSEQGSETAETTDAANDLTKLSWECTSDNEAIATALGVLYDDEGVIAYVRAGEETGQCTVRMSAKSVGVEIVFECDVREDGTIFITSHGITGIEAAA